MDARRTYPPDLQAVISHALRFCDLVEAQGGSAPPIGLAQAWFVGRPLEIQAVIALLIADWEKGRYEAEGAAAAGRSYLEELHEAFRGVRGRRVELTCCRPDPDPGVVMVGPPAEQTAFDPAAVLQVVRPVDLTPTQPRVVAIAAATPPPHSSRGTVAAGSPAVPAASLTRVK